MAQHMLDRIPGLNFLSFYDRPKQWLLSSSQLPEPQDGRLHQFGRFSLALANGVPVVEARRAGQVQGVLIGWPINAGRLFSVDGAIDLADGQDPDALFRELGGRFVMIWWDPDGTLWLREDASGGLPAVYSAEHRIAGSTVTMLDQVAPLTRAPEMREIFDFPRQRGFLPFGLTARREARRVTPGHRLSLDDWSCRRDWPLPGFPRRVAEGQTDPLVDEAVRIAQSHVAAVLAQGPTVLYLSGGHDSRQVLAAARAQADRLRCETLGDEGAIDGHVASQVARRAGVAHRLVEILPVSDGEIAAWIERSGEAIFDPVTRLVRTAVENYPGSHPLSGTGAEIMRGSNWQAGDAERAGLDVDLLLARLRLPPHPIVVRAAEEWLAGVPAADAAAVLDLAKIEQIHGCWAGSSIYGHPLQLPTISPFAGRRLNEIALSLPKSYKEQDRFYRDFLARTWPELLDIPVNRATGAARLKFLKLEVKRLIPDGLKRRLKPYR